LGPGLALAVLGANAAAPTALIFCCDSIFLFTIVPLLIELSERDHPSAACVRRRAAADRALAFP
jgi:phosphosulfolactate phosphohydrolase-like enzyme